MRVDLDAKVQTADGEHAGSVQRAVLDPETQEVCAFVVSTGALFGRDVLVKREDLERASRDGEVVRLDLTKRQLEELPDYLPHDYVVPPAGWYPPMGFAYPATGYLWPAAYAFPPAVPTAAGEGADEDESEITLSKGSAVMDSTGDDIGVVDDVLLDEGTGQLRGFELRIGSAWRTFFGGGDKVEVDRRHVAKVEREGVYLRVDKDSLKPG